MKKWKWWLVFILITAAIISITLAISKTYKVDEIKLEKPIIAKPQNPKVTQKDIVKLYKVVRVIDGDTIVIEYNGNEEKARLIGVNTPETVDPRRKVECFGKEASDYTKELLGGKNIRTEFDETQNERDKYGRLLLYIYLGDILVNKEIIKNGYGHEYTYVHPYKHREDFKAAENYAKENKLGLWLDNACVK